MDDLTALLHGAEPVLAAAADKLVALQHGPLRTERKDLLDVVTEADLAAEEIVVQGLTRLTPNAAILAEERGASAGRSDGRWIIDPLDGTVNYATGLPWFSVTAAYEVGGEVQVGVTHAPSVPLIACYVRNRLATVNDRPVQARATRSLADAVVSVCLTSHFSADDVRRTAAIVARLGGMARGVRVVVSGGLELALVAAGRLDGFVSIKADVVSHATGMALVRAAGGRVTNVAGVDSTLDDLEKIACAPGIHGELVAVIREALAAA